MHERVNDNMEVLLEVELLFNHPLLDLTGHVVHDNLVSFTRTMFFKPPQLADHYESTICDNFTER